MRIGNNEHLNPEDKKIVVESRKSAREHAKQDKVRGSKTKTRHKAKWKIDSEQLRSAMKANREFR